MAKKQEEQIPAVRLHNSQKTSMGDAENTTEKERCFYPSELVGAIEFQGCRYLLSTLSQGKKYTIQEAQNELKRIRERRT